MLSGDSPEYAKYMILRRSAPRWSIDISDPPAPQPDHAIDRSGPREHQCSNALPEVEAATQIVEWNNFADRQAQLTVGAIDPSLSDETDVFGKVTVPILRARQFPQP